MDDDAKLKTINHFFQVHRTSTDGCLEPSEKCRESAIRSHSIPSSVVLDRLARDGHLIMPQMKLKVPPPGEIEFKQIGKNKATTFTGLCAKHDNHLFRPIDNGLPDLGTPQHLFLLAYRAVLREFHAVLQNAARFQSTYLKRVEVGLSPGDRPDNFGINGDRSSLVVPPLLSRKPRSRPSAKAPGKTAKPPPHHPPEAAVPPALLPPKNAQARVQAIPTTSRWSSTAPKSIARATAWRGPPRSRRIRSIWKRAFAG